MSNPDAVMLRVFLTDPAIRDQTSRFLQLASERGPLWLGLDVKLAREIARFERLQIASAYARLQGASPDLIVPTQTILMRSAIDTLIPHVAGVGEQIKEHRDKRELAAVMHHIVRVFAASVDETDLVFAAHGMCRSAAFALEDAIRAAVEDPKGPQAILDAYRATLVHLLKFPEGEKLPAGWTGFALLWVTTLWGLGDLASDSDTTEHYA
ncbi:MAG: hypothetical protein R3F61_24115 [Myxococcota bacterium]